MVGRNEELVSDRLNVQIFPLHFIVKILNVQQG